MTIWNKISSFLSTRRGFVVGLTLILVLATISRFWRLSAPPTYYFDEVYHALTSKLIARNDPRAFEWWNEPIEPNTAVDWLHPPLAKYTQAVSMKVFGENSLGWRFSSAVFGVLVIAATALVAHVFFRKRAVTLLAALLASFDGLLLTQSRIAMNDIHVTFFILMTIALYGWYRNREQQHQPTTLALLATGVTAGLAMGTKWSGVYILIAVVIAQCVRITRITGGFTKKLKQLVVTAVLLGLVPALIYLSSYSLMFLQGKTLICTGTEIKQGSCYCSQESSTWVKVLTRIVPTKQAYFESLEARGGCKRLISHFSELHHQILWYQTHLSATHPYQSRPWEWVLDLRPVWQYVNYDRVDQGWIANIYNVGNPLLFWVGLTTVISLTFLLFIHKARIGYESQRKTLAPHPWKIGFLLIVYFIVWGPWNFSPRIMFFYHYAPAVPIMSLLISYLLVNSWKRVKSTRLLIFLLVAAMGLVYLVLFPLNTGLYLHQAYFDAIFSIFPSWR